MDAETLARKRWRQVEKAVAKREDIGRKLVEARARVAELTSAHPAAEQRDREARGYALAEGKPSPSREAEQVARQLAEAQENVIDLDAAASVVARQFQNVLAANAPSWVEAQRRAIEKAGDAVMAAVASLEQSARKIEDERALLAWIAPASVEGSVDPYGGRLTYSGTLAASLEQVRAAAAGLAAGEESGQPEPGREPTWVEKRLAARARPGWGG